jgi:phage tail tape-measure protein
VVALPVLTPLYAGQKETAKVGAGDGLRVGTLVGCAEGAFVGTRVGRGVGPRVGALVGSLVGEGVSLAVGWREGCGVGRGDGRGEGLGEGSNVGLGEGACAWVAPMTTIVPVHAAVPAHDSSMRYTPHCEKRENSSMAPPPHELARDDVASKVEPK